MVETIIRAKGVVGKTVVSEETGKKYGVTGNVDFITESGELLNLVIEEATKPLRNLNLKTDERGRILIPFSAVKSIGDFIIVSENELI